MKGKRILAVLIILCMCLGMFTGCGNDTTNVENTEDKSNSDDGSTESKDTNSGKQKVSMWHGLTDVELPAFQKVIEDFNATNDEIEIELIYVPREELLKQLTIGNLAGDMADLAMIDNPDTAGFASAGVLEELTDLYNEWDENQFLEGPINSVKYDDKIYGVPYTSNCLALFYDEDMLVEAGVEVPTTWEELNVAAEKTTTDNRYGLAISGIKNEESVFQFVPFVASAGGVVEQINSAEAISAISFLTDLVDAGSMSKEIVSWSQADVEKQFATGKAAMMVNGPWNVSAVKEDAPDKNWNVTFIPAAENGDYASCLGGENLCITKGANKEAAWEVIKYICGSEINAELSKSFTKFSPRADVDTNALYGDDEIMKSFAEIMSTAVPRGPHPKWTEVSTVLQAMLQECYTSGKTPEEAASDAQVKIDEINNN